MFILTLSVLYFLPFAKNMMEFDFFFYYEKVCWKEGRKEHWYGTKLLFFVILHLSHQLVCQDLCEHGMISTFKPHIHQLLKIVRYYIPKLQ